jgi:peptidoglycan/xylan/chitin deacetylase (PgdA/CDA1 family)
MVTTPLPSRLKARARRFVADAYYRSAHFKKRLRGKVVILTYHRVLTRADLDRQYVQPGMYVLADVFARHAQFLAEHFHVLSLAELFERWRSNGLDGGTRYCVITFDDGWLDNYVHAFPVLRALGLPATIFLPTRFIGTDEWFWPDRLAYLLERQREAASQGHGDPTWAEQVERTISSWKMRDADSIERELAALARDLGVSMSSERIVVNWDEVAEMGRHGISFGSHSATHAILPGVRSERLHEEVDDSLHVLRERSDNCVPVFCYPNGSHTDEVVARVRKAGYMGAVTTAFGWETRAPVDLYRLPRISVHNDITDTLPLFAFHVSRLNHVMGGDDA